LVEGLEEGLEEGVEERFAVCVLAEPPADIMSFCVFSQKEWISVQFSSEFGVRLLRLVD
jgi:hypothetical protein